MKNYLANKMNAVREGMKDNKGFSLVELIIVVAIMAVLMGILAPQYLRFVESSREQADVTAVNGMLQAMTIAMSIVEGVSTTESVTFSVDSSTGKTKFVVADSTSDTKFTKEITATIGAEDTIQLSSNWAMDNAPALTIVVTGGVPKVICATTNGNGYDGVDTWAERLSIDAA